MNVSINIHKYWKIILILSIIIFTVVFFVYSEKIATLYENINDENFEVQNLINFEGPARKINTSLNKSDFDNIIIPENKTLYYFPEDCPSYKEDIFLHVTEGGLDKYFVPEKGNLILVDKKHLWTKKPDKIAMWKK